MATTRPTVTNTAEQMGANMDEAEETVTSEEESVASLAGTILGESLLGAGSMVGPGGIAGGIGQSSKICTL
jgi:hypothetical protein